MRLQQFNKKESKVPGLNGLIDTTKLPWKTPADLHWIFVLYLSKML